MVRRTTCSTWSKRRAGLFDPRPWAERERVHQNLPGIHGGGEILSEERREAKRDDHRRQEAGNERPGSAERKQQQRTVVPLRTREK